MLKHFNIVEYTKRSSVLELKVRALLKEIVQYEDDYQSDIAEIQRIFKDRLDSIKTGNNMHASYAYKLEPINKDGKLAGLMLVHMNLKGDRDRKVLSILPKEVTL